jgi:hypothetical protein
VTWVEKLKGAWFWLEVDEETAPKFMVALGSLEVVPLLAMEEVAESEV